MILAAQSIEGNPKTSARVQLTFWFSCTVEEKDFSGKGALDSCRRRFNYPPNFDLHNLSVSLKTKKSTAPLKNLPHIYECLGVIKLMNPGPYRPLYLWGWLVGGINEPPPAKGGF
jgi:hypothetical protein